MHSDPTQKTLKMRLKLFAFCGPFIALAFLFYPMGYFVLGPDPAPSNTQVSVPITSGKVQAYIINLDRAPERYASVKNLVGSLGFPVTRLSATDGKTLSNMEIQEKVDGTIYEKLMGHSAQLGTIGCYLSHLRTWQAFLDSDAEFALVFEDDIHFDSARLRETIDELLQNNHLWDSVSFDLFGTANPWTLTTLKNNGKLSVYPKQVTHSGAYLMNRKAAQKWIAKALPIKMPVDHYFIRSWEFGLQFTGIENPRLVSQTFGDSHIVHSQRLSDQPLPWIYPLSQKLFHFQSSIAWFFYNLKTYISAKV